MEFLSKKCANKLKRKNSKALLKAEYPLLRASVESQRKNRIASNDLLQKIMAIDFLGQNAIVAPYKLIPKISEEFYYHGSFTDV